MAESKEIAPRTTQWVDENVIKSIDQTFSTTFAPPSERSIFEATRLLRFDQGRLEGLPPPFVVESTVLEADVLQEIASAQDICQVITIRQKHSYARLDISRVFFEQLLKEYKVFRRIWDFILPFSFKTSESDIGHAPIRFHMRSLSKRSKPASFECAYGLRYVELNGRQPTENTDHDPWSIRQTAIYQQYDQKLNRIVFLLISPSDAVKTAFTLSLKGAGSDDKKLNPFDLHLIIVSLLHSNWRLYIRSLEKVMREQSDRVILAQVQKEDVKLSPLLDFQVNFVDRQRLKMIEDKILDLMLIFESLHNTLSMLQKQCQKHCLGSDCQDCTCQSTIDELEEQKHEGQVNLSKARILHKRAQATAHLLSDLLDCENALALNGLVKETKDENSKMRVLSERSTRDATAVKLLTVITLIYLPVTVVANFFSSQLIGVDEDTGQLHVVAGAWWFAVISIPLTILTFIIWWWWLRVATAAAERKQNTNTEINTEGAGNSTERDFASKTSYWSKDSVPGRVFRSRKGGGLIGPSSTIQDV